MKAKFLISFLIFTYPSFAVNNYLWIYLDPKKLSSNIIKKYSPILYLVTISRASNEIKSDNIYISKFHLKLYEKFSSQFKGKQEVAFKLSYNWISHTDNIRELCRTLLELDSSFDIVSVEKITDGDLIPKCPLSKESSLEAILRYIPPSQEEGKLGYGVKIYEKNEKKFVPDARKERNLTVRRQKRGVTANTSRF